MTTLAGILQIGMDQCKKEKQEAPPPTDQQGPPVPPLEDQRILMPLRWPITAAEPGKPKAVPEEELVENLEDLSKTSATPELEPSPEQLGRW